MLTIEEEPFARLLRKDVPGTHVSTQVKLKFKETLEHTITADSETMLTTEALTYGHAPGGARPGSLS